jgi:hypothetical protein
MTKPNDDLREQVADAIYFALPENDWYEHASAFEVADAAIAVAEPLIRAKVIEELAEKAEQLEAMTTPGGRWHGEHLADWIRAQADEPDDKKIYIGFKQKDKDRDHD